ncbi:MAG: hypothetical protein LBD60_00800 [Puniceicoccales bacterium]|jgi:hypothetical protein|nr:hypothetical protein [Puniceicoccales bacterium]
MKIYFSIFSFLGVVFFNSGNVFSAGAPCFGFECFENENANNPGVALGEYDHIQAKSALTAPLPAGNPVVPGGNDNVSFWVSSFSLVHWSCNQYQFGGPLNFQEKAQMAIDRASIGIPVNFQHPVIIQALAAGIPIAAIAAGLGVAVLPVQQYVDRAFTGGGYSNPRAAMLYRLRYNPILPPALFTNPNGNTDLMALHIRLPIRVSKNMKELQCNGLLDPVTSNQISAQNPVNPPPPPGSYISIKSRIDGIFAAAGLPTPSSITVVSHDMIPED